MRLTESQLLQAPSTRLREQEEDEDDLEPEEDDIHEVVLPSAVSDTDGVDEGVEESGATTEGLEDGDTLGTGVVWEEFDEESWEIMVSTL